MNDKNDLTLTSIFAGDRHHGLLPQRVRNRIHEKTKSIFKSKNAVFQPLVETQNITFNLGADLEIVEAPLSTGKHIKTTAKDQINFLGLKIDLDHSIFIDDKPVVYVSKDGREYYMVCDRCGTDLKFSQHSLCPKCMRELHDEVMHENQTLKLKSKLVSMEL